MIEEENELEELDDYDTEIDEDDDLDDIIDPDEDPDEDPDDELEVCPTCGSAIDENGLCDCEDED